ncbi:hypothetical protein CAPN006_04510 [Capnocytophaga canimorsus]|uniref:AAA family ATPase n=1 Tax=Capnocytophaga canimorsus TaxID=28188 RepID=UPI001AC2E677|nr:AAA family ATPase [Capnocytophaga canimorsus]GIM56057.1 hypothetical protein CAPN006_04510 [Capnocytophaga canimorsus]
MEKLIIKNFGPISEAEIEIKKYTLLIGDTSTGKSIIAKLICIFEKCMIEGIQDIEKFKILLHNYGMPFLGKTTQIEYVKGNQFIFIEESTLNRSISVNSEMIRRALEIIAQQAFKDEPIVSHKDEQIIKKGQDFLSSINEVSPIYIPAERMFFSMLGKSISGLWANNVSVSKSYLDFAGYYEVAKKNSSKVNYSDLGFTYHNSNDKEYVEYKGQKLDIQYTSSGVQAILPLIVVLNYLAETKKDLENSDQMICVEEPEISLFPQRQKELVEHIVSIVNRINSRLVITTHSPYVLSAFNNMMLASNTAIEKEERKEEIKNIISEDKWIRYEDVSAYEVKDGKVISLLDEEFKGLDVNAIDKVSDIITEQVDQLISIRYEE